MPVALSKDYDALAIVLDERKNGNTSFFTKELNRIFERKKMIYYQNCDMSVQEIYQDINQKIEEAKIIFPPSQRIVFCHYMDLNDLDEGWLEHYGDMMRYFADMAMIASPAQHYHLTFFRYQVGRRLEAKKEEIFRTLNLFWEQKYQYTNQAQFLLYAAGLGNNLDSQEKGMVRLLQLLTSKGFTAVFQPSSYKHGLYVLNEYKYYEKEARDCQEKINEIDEWLHSHRDAGLNNFFLRLMGNVTGKMSEYQNEMGQFGSMSGMYPISIREYTPHGFGPFRSYTRPAGVHPALKEVKEDVQKSFFKALEDCSEKGNWQENALEGMNCPDLEELLEAHENEMIKKRLHQIVDTGASDKRLDEDEKNQFKQAFETWIKEVFVKKITREILKDKKDNVRDKRLDLENKKSVASRYQNLAVCFASIESDTTYRVPAVIPVANIGKLAIINDKIGNKWAVEGYAIEGVMNSQIVIRDDIYPYEIVFMKFGKYVSLNPDRPEESIEALKMVFL